MNFLNPCMMQKFVLILTVFLTLSCLSFNTTFPLHKVTEGSNLCQNRTHNFAHVDKAKRMTVNVFKRFKDNPKDEKDLSTSNISANPSNMTTHQTNDKIPMSDLRQFEQLVIMKKYPYLDLKEFEAKYTLSPEHARHNQKLYSGSNFGSDPGLCDNHAVEADSPSVEVSNRGLSGFAMPKLGDKKYAQEFVDPNRTVQINLAIPNKTIKTVVESLRNDVKSFLQDKGIANKVKEIND